MSDERWQHIKALFAEALEVEPDRRDDLIARRCPDDVAMREEVRSLLRSHEAAGQFIETPAAPLVSAGLVQTRDWQGRMIGPYRLEREIGHGGMGTVYLASRADGAFDKQVAVKVIRRGLGTDDILLRFRHERETLAGLEHPNIARLLDGGTTDDGQPYFVMEHVAGIPIDTYCDEQRLTVVERLRIFRTVCSAVQAAHQSLVVHRDLKPDNILVAADGVPKLVDFGIAKVLAPSTGGVVQTAPAEQFLTPEYASPEQIGGRAITAASDIYSLGVLLYELLTGRNPFREGRQAASRFGPDAVERTIEKPSDAVLLPREIPTEDGQPRMMSPAEVSFHRRVSPAALRRRLAGDLDTIVSVAMREQPERRYGSVEQLSEDVRRHLEGLPILARGDALGYRAARFVTRHAAGVAAAALLVAAIITMLAVSLWQGRAVAEQRDRARVEAEKAQRISGFLQEMLRSPDPVNQGPNVRVVDVLDRAARRVERGTDPEVAVPIRRALGRTYYSLGLYEAAAKHLRAAMSALGGNGPEATAERAAVEAELADVVSSAGDWPGAEKMYVHALRVFEGLGLREDLRRADALNGLGELLRERGDDVAAESRYREALAIRRRVLGSRDIAVAESLNNLAVVSHARNNLAEAELLYRQSLDIVRAARGDDHPGVPATLTNLATVLASRGDFAAAEPLYREALQIRRHLLGDDHPDVTFTMYALADDLHSLGRYGEAAALCRNVLSRRGRTLPAQHPVIAASFLILGKCLDEQGDHRGAETALRRALTLRRAVLPPGHWQIASAESALGLCLGRQRRFREAEPLLIGSFERLNNDRGPRHERTRDALRNLVEIYEAWGRPDKAARYRALGQ